MTNLLVKDDAATPKEWTLVPVTDTPNPYWRATDPLLPLDGQPRFTATYEKLKNGNHKVSFKLELPIMETLGASGTAVGYVAPPKVAYTEVGITTFFHDKRSTIGDRANVCKMHLGMVQGASSTTATGILNQASAGGAFAASVLPLTYMAVNVIVPN
jgi:hypothetical protein